MWGSRGENKCFAYLEQIYILGKNHSLGAHHMAGRRGAISLLLFYFSFGIEPQREPRRLGRLVLALDSGS